METSEFEFQKWLKSNYFPYKGKYCHKGNFEKIKKYLITKQQALWLWKLTLKTP